MSLPLLRKELHENTTLFLALGLTQAFVTLLMILAHNDEGRFGALVSLTVGWTYLLAIALHNRLIVAEHTARTITLLEALPLTRAQVLLTKGGLAAAVITANHLLSWAAVWAVQRLNEALDATSAGYALLTTGSAALALSAWGLLAASAGRYRYLVWFAAVITLSSLSDGPIPEERLPFAGLLNDAARSATAPPEPAALVSTWAVTVAAVALAAALSTWSDGELSSRLARQMTRQERTTLISVAAAGGFILFLVSESRTRPPLVLQGAEDAVIGVAQVSALPTGAFTRPTARMLADRVAEDVSSFAAALGWATAPKVYLTPRAGIDRHLVLPGSAGRSAGVAAVFDDRDADLDEVRAFVLHQALEAATDDAATREDRHAWADGLTEWWPARADAALRERYWARSELAAAPDAAALRAWHTTAEQLGPCVASAMAFTVIDTLAAAHGEAAVVNLARRVFPTAATRSAWAWRAPAPSDALSELGTSVEALLARVAATRATRAPAPRPDLIAHLTFSAPAGGQRTAAVETIPRAWVLYRSLGPWTSGIQSARLPRLDLPNGRATLPGVWMSGARVFVAFERWDDDMKCPVRFAARREVVP